MKTSELMQGDFLRYKQDFPTTHLQGKIVKVCNIGGRVSVRTMDDGILHEHEHPDWLEPIPLTPKILEKNGFTFYGESWYIPHNDKNKGESVMVGFYMYCTTINIKKGNGAYYKEVPCNYRCNAEYRGIYVHDFQHALQLCKINKEIVL